MGCSRSCKQKTLAISGILSAIIGSFMLGFFDQIFDVIFNKVRSISCHGGGKNNSVLLK